MSDKSCKVCDRSTAPLADGQLPLYICRSMHVLTDRTSLHGALNADSYCNVAKDRWSTGAEEQKSKI